MYDYPKTKRHCPGIWDSAFAFISCIDKIQGLESCIELCASLELCNLLGSNSDFLLCCRVDSLTSRTLVNRESSETYESNLVICRESLLDSVESSIKCLL